MASNKAETQQAETSSTPGDPVDPPVQPAGQSEVEPMTTEEPVEPPPKGSLVMKHHPEEKPEAYKLPPGLTDAGLEGVVGVTSGQFTLASGASYYMQPGMPFAVMPADAAELVEQGAAVKLSDFSPQS